MFILIDASERDHSFERHGETRSAADDDYIRLLARSKRCGSPAGASAVLDTDVRIRRRGESGITADAVCRAGPRLARNWHAHAGVPELLEIVFAVGTVQLVGDNHYRRSEQNGTPVREAPV